MNLLKLLYVVYVRRLGSFDIKIKDGLVVEHEVTAGVLQRRVRRQDGVVRLDDGCRHMRRESTSSSGAKRVEDEE